MNDTLETYDPHLARKLERRKANAASYDLWVFQNAATSYINCKTIQEARTRWVEFSKLNKWDGWKLQQNGIVIKNRVYCIIELSNT